MEILNYHIDFGHLIHVVYHRVERTLHYENVQKKLQREWKIPSSYHLNPLRGE